MRRHIGFDKFNYPRPPRVQRAQGNSLLIARPVEKEVHEESDFFFPFFGWTGEKKLCGGAHRYTGFSFSFGEEDRLGVGGETIPVSFTAVHAPNRINMAEITERDRYAKRWTDEARGPHSTGGAVNVELSTRGRGWLFRWFNQRGWTFVIQFATPTVPATLLSSSTFSSAAADLFYANSAAPSHPSDTNAIPPSSVRAHPFAPRFLRLSPLPNCVVKNVYIYMRDLYVFGSHPGKKRKQL